jgi:transposase
MASSARSAKAEHWRGIFDQFQQSGQTVQAFCTEKGLSIPSFYQWRRRLRGGDTTALTGLVPVKLLPATPREVAVPIQIVTPNGFSVRLDSSIPTEALARLLCTIASSTERDGTC